MFYFQKCLELTTFNEIYHSDLIFSLSSTRRGEEKVRKEIRSLWNLYNHFMTTCFWNKIIWSHSPIELLHSYIHKRDYIWMTLTFLFTPTSWLLVLFSFLFITFLLFCLIFSYLDQWHEKFLFTNKNEYVMFVEWCSNIDTVV